MSVQHRARIRTVADYSADFSDVGSCCYPPNHSLYDIDSPTVPIDNVTYQECISEGGYFLPEGGECPNLSQPGCCCACSYVPNDEWEEFFEHPDPNGPNGCPDSTDPLSCYQGGLKEVTVCECNSIGGIWSPLPCSYYYEPGQHQGVGADVLCNPTEEGVEDVRFPGACCHESIEGNCANICSFEECAELIGDGVDGVFYENDTCNDDLPECGNSSGGSGVKRHRGTNLIIGEELKQRAMEGNYDKRDEKSCCIYQMKDNVLCKRTIESDCDGHFGGFDEGGQSLQCTDERCSDIKNYITNNKSSIDRSVIDNWYIGKNVLNMGFYAGEFYVNSEVYGDSPTIYGNLKTGEVQPYKTEDTTENSKEKYAVVVYPYDILGVSYNSSKIRSVINSSWDSIHNNDINKNLDLTKRINSLDDNNWMIPSVDLFGWMYEQVNSNEFITNVLSENENPNMTFSTWGIDRFYWTSSVLQQPSGNYFYIHKGDFVAGCNADTVHRVRPVCVLKING